MHTTQINCTIFIHNGDCSGNVEIYRPRKASERESITLPFADLVGLVANWKRTKLISAIEQATDEEIIQDYLGVAK
jgi:hypothetical protein